MKNQMSPGRSQLSLSSHPLFFNRIIRKLVALRMHINTSSGNHLSPADTKKAPEIDYWWCLLSIKICFGIFNLKVILWSNFPKVHCRCNITHSFVKCYSEQKVDQTENLQK